MQRTQLKSVTKDELIESILSSKNDALHTVTTKLDVLMNDVADLKKTIESKDNTLHAKIKELQSQVDKQAEIITNHQRFLENIDRKEQECNLIITGVLDEHESLEGATLDSEKITKIWKKVSATTEVREARRLGNSVSNTDGTPRRRAMFVTVANRDERDVVLGKAKTLKTSGDTYNKIYIKKNVHPSVRVEWRRLRDAEKTEKERPENVGCNIYLNTQERQLYKDGEVIDKWSVMGF